MSKIREFARGQECQIRIPGACNHDTQTTVLAHIGGAGMGLKSNDLEAAFSCSACHLVVDGQRGSFDKTLIKLWHHEGAARTRKILLNAGLIKI